MIYSIIHFGPRRTTSRTARRSTGTPGSRSHGRLIPLVLVTVIAIVSAIVLQSERRARRATRCSINVTAQQFAWTFSYPDAGNATSRVLRLPINRSVELDMRALDVIHSFFVPEFAVKEDIVPGLVTHLNITPNRLGTYSARVHGALRARPLAHAHAGDRHDRRGVRHVARAPEGGGEHAMRKILLGAGWIRAAWMFVAFGAIGLGIVAGSAAGPPAGIRSSSRSRPSSSPALVARADRLPRRHRRLRLLDELRARQADARARRPLRPRREELEGLLPGQHRPQGDRRPVPRHDDLLLHHRRDARAARPRAARDAAWPVLRAAVVQRASSPSTRR